MPVPDPPHPATQAAAPGTAHAGNALHAHGSTRSHSSAERNSLLQTARLRIAQLPGSLGMLLSPLLPAPANTSAWRLWKLPPLRALPALNQHQQAHKDTLQYIKRARGRTQYIKSYILRRPLKLCYLPAYCILDKCIVNQANFQFLKNRY